jgi:hypothetical protein
VKCASAGDGAGADQRGHDGVPRQQGGGDGPQPSSQRCGLGGEIPHYLHSAHARKKQCRKNIKSVQYMKTKDWGNVIFGLAVSLT